MFKDVLNHMNGATDYASIGLVLFFLVFIAVSIRTAMQKRKDVDGWALLPLEDEKPEVKR